MDSALCFLVLLTSCVGHSSVHGCCDGPRSPTCRQSREIQRRTLPPPLVASRNHNVHRPELHVDPHNNTSRHVLAQCSLGHHLLECKQPDHGHAVLWRLGASTRKQTQTAVGNSGFVGVPHKTALAGLGRRLRTHQAPRSPKSASHAATRLLRLDEDWSAHEPSRELMQCAQTPTRLRGFHAFCHQHVPRGRTSEPSRWVKMCPTDETRDLVMACFLAGQNTLATDCTRVCKKCCDKLCIVGAAYFVKNDHARE